ncbi:hypothetical protein, partial [Cellulomonas septica]|uniref:hypothetical protein n=1 Tax=Cellulomonas septica TaxID=285080 RepID=UPI001B349444
MSSRRARAGATKRATSVPVRCTVVTRSPPTSSTSDGTSDASADVRRSLGGTRRRPLPTSTSTLG